MTAKSSKPDIFPRKLRLPQWLRGVFILRRFTPTTFLLSATLALRVDVTFCLLSRLASIPRVCLEDDFPTREVAVCLSTPKLPASAS
jgi:hypothetical protein